MTERREEGRQLRGSEPVRSQPSPPAHADRQAMDALLAENKTLAAANEALRRRVRELEGGLVGEQGGALAGEQLEALRTSAFLNNQLIVAWLKDDQGRYAFLSSEYQRRFGGEEHQWLGKSDEQMWPPEIAATFQKHDQQVLETGKPLEVIKDAVYTDRSQEKINRLKIQLTQETETNNLNRYSDCDLLPARLAWERIMATLKRAR